MMKVNVKWGKEKYVVDLNTEEPPIVFKSQLYALTSVPPDRQKIMGVKGGMLKDDADWTAVGVKEGHNFMLVGSAEEIPKAPETKVVFMEDLPPDQAQDLLQAAYPPGLSNMGNTCYMNATLQCFRNVPELKDALVKYKGQVSDEDQATSLTSALRDLFVQMDISNKVLRRVFPQFAQQGPNGGYMQQDAEECWVQLMQTLSTKLPRLLEPVQGAASSSQASSSSSAPNLKNSAISDIFAGEFLSSLKCIEADQEEPVVKNESFLKLVCHISNSTSFLIHGLKEAMEEPLSKLSPTLNREAKYIRSSKISKLPYYLNIQFMRFFWRQDKKLKAKIVKPVEYSLILDVYDLCTPELQAQLAPKRRAIELAEDQRLERDRQASKRKASEEDDAAQKQDSKEKEKEKEKDVTMSDAEISKPENPANTTEKFTNDTGKYELIAVLTHKGRSADSGHYIAWIKQAEDKWLKYDDDTVSPCTNDDVKKLDGKGGGDWHIAYMCLYKTYTPPPL